MTKLTLPIQIGKKYVRRDGTVITAREPHPSMSHQVAYVGDMDAATNDPFRHAFTKSGRINNDSPCEHLFDLVADHIEQSAPTPLPAGQHPYAHILRAIADGQAVQWQTSNGTWNNQSAADTLVEIAHKQYTPDRYRVKPRTITINGHEVPEPLRVEPPEGTSYWVPAILSPHGKNTSARSWTEGDNGHRWLQQGLVHLTPEAAQAHAEALLTFTSNT